MGGIYFRYEVQPNREERIRLPDEGGAGIISKGCHAEEVNDAVVGRDHVMRLECAETGIDRAWQAEAYVSGIQQLRSIGGELGEYAAVRRFATVCGLAAWVGVHLREV